MPVIADAIQNADAVLSDMLSLTSAALSMTKALTPIQELMKNSTVRKSPPVLVAESGKVLQDNFFEDFSIAFPAVATGITNGRLGHASYRVHDGIYKLGTVMPAIKAKKFMIMSDEERKTLHEEMKDVVADFAIYTIITFQLHRSIEDVTTMATSKACERRQITARVMYGELLSTVESLNRAYYAYEPLSAFYTDMLAAEPIFMAECEENQLPLTEEMAHDILTGKTTSARVMEQLLRQTADMESKEVDVNPVSLIQRMSLE